LVDSGSEHPPLISQTLADKLGLQGPIAGGATEANGAFLPLRDVGNIDMILHGQAVRQNFPSAPSLHYDVIMGEPYMRENSIVMDYAHNVSWQCSHGALKPVTFDGSLRSDAQSVEGDLQAQAHFHAQTTRTAMLVSAVTTDLRHATMSPADRQSEILHEDMERDRIRAILFQRKPGLHMLGGVGKELPENAGLECSVDMEIPGLVPSLARAFDIVETEVWAQLGTSPNRNKLILSVFWRAMSQPSLRHVTCLDWHHTTIQTVGSGHYGGGRSPISRGSSVPCCATTLARSESSDCSIGGRRHHPPKSELVCTTGAVCTKKGWAPMFVYSLPQTRLSDPAGLLSYPSGYRPHSKKWSSHVFQTGS